MKSVVLFAVLAFGLVACQAPPETYVTADGSVCKRIGYSFQNYWMNEKKPACFAMIGTDLSGMNPIKPAARGDGLPIARRDPD